jgi:hypothetical protein
MSIKVSKDLIHGGLADKQKSGFDPKQLRKGIKVEMEHTKNPDLAREIAQDHLSEDPKYYDHLEKMEQKYSKAYVLASIYFECAKFAQDQTNTPNITIQPGRPEANCALDILKRWKPGYFIGVRNIVIGPSPNYGYVESGPDKDPTVIYINADRIVNESGQQRGKAAAIATARVIAHEKGHVDSFDEGQGFVGGETPAQAQETEFDNWLKSGGMKQIESLPSYQALS